MTGSSAPPRCSGRTNASPSWRSTIPTTSETTPFISSSHRVTVGVSALLELAQWCRKRRDLTSGESRCATRQPTAVPPGPATKQELLIRKSLWNHRPHDQQLQVIQTLGRVLARALPPPQPKE